MSAPARSPARRASGARSREMARACLLRCWKSLVNRVAGGNIEEASRPMDPIANARLDLTHNHENADRKEGRGEYRTLAATPQPQLNL